MDTPKPRMPLTVSETISETVSCGFGAGFAVRTTDNVRSAGVVLAAVVWDSWKPFLNVAIAGR
jgi:hypothetical protein